MTPRIGNDMINTKIHELNQEIITALGKMCQDFATQMQMYGEIPDLPDDIVLDLDSAIFRSSERVLERNPDIAELDTLITTKSGILEYWTYEALEASEFWADIRRLSTKCLVDRGISTEAPHINIGFINVDELFPRKQWRIGQLLVRKLSNIFSTR
jgi:hypothetical protein